MKSFKLLLLLVLLPISVWGVRDLLPRAKTTWMLKRENSNLARELVAREEEKQALQDRLHDLSLPRRIEEEAKLRLQVRRPGEEVVIIVPPKEAPGTTTPSADRKKEGLLAPVLNILERLFGGE
jgi:cell division protein FtsB